MLEYNLTRRERQILIRLPDLPRHSKEHFAARLVDPEAAGPVRELARLDFGGEACGTSCGRTGTRKRGHTRGAGGAPGPRAVRWLATITRPFTMLGALSLPLFVAAVRDVS